MFTVYSLYIHYIFTIYSLYIHYIFTIYSLYIHYIFTICRIQPGKAATSAGKLPAIQLLSSSLINVPFRRSSQFYLLSPSTSYILQLIRYARCCSHYDDFRYDHKCLVDRLLSQGKKFYSRYQDLIKKYQRSVKVIVKDSLQLRSLFDI